MDFVRYAERAADLVNADLPDPDAVRAFLADRAWLVPQVTDRDAGALRRLQRALRAVFEASSHEVQEDVVNRLNELLDQHPITPHIAGHDSQTWHLHVSNRASSVAQLLTAESLLGLATLVTDLGALRLGVCRAGGCEQVFVDTSPNSSRRYCSDRCSSRANVAAHRARRRAEEQPRAGQGATA
jgi:predicted RNA-binding Zn ribbon-like protein